MKLIKWKLKIKKIANITNLIIFSINSNNLINIVDEDTNIFFYTLENQEKVLMMIDNNYFELNLKENNYNFEEYNIVKAILFYEQIEHYYYKNNKQNKLDDRYIYSRKYNTLIPEYQYNYLIILIRDILNQQYLGSNYLSMLITYLFGYLMRSNFSSIFVKNFIKKFNINTNNYIINGPSFNDFFTRELKYPLSIIKNSDIIYTPTTSRNMFYNFKNLYKMKLYIKGKNFNLYKLINEPSIQKKYSVIISRLSILDYHHVHMPEDGILYKIKEYNGNYISVDKDYLRSELDVLNDNKRVLLKFKRDDGSNFYLVLIGSILISSIVHNLEIHKKYYTREKIAYFQFGGSCVVYVSDKNIFFNDDLIYYTNQNIESYTKVGEEVGNITNQKYINYIKNYNIKKNIIGFLDKILHMIINFLIKINKKYLFNIEII